MGNLYSHYVFRPPACATYEDRDGHMLFLARSRGPGATGGCGGGGGGGGGGWGWRVCEEKLIYLSRRGGGRIPAVHIERPGAEFTLIFAHGNAEDLGTAAGQAAAVAEDLGVNVLAFEYTGYGLSEGPARSRWLPGPRHHHHHHHHPHKHHKHPPRRHRPRASESALYEDIDAAWRYLVWERGVARRRVVVLGRSLGSGPAVHLAARRAVAGVILVAPVASAVRVALRRLNVTVPLLDSFVNVDRVKRVPCPVLVVHGDHDPVVPKAHAEALLRKAPHPVTPLWVRGAAHNNVVEDFQSMVFSRYARFLKEVAARDRRSPRRKSIALRRSDDAAVAAAAAAVRRSLSEAAVDDMCTKLENPGSSPSSPLNTTTTTITTTALDSPKLMTNHLAYRASVDSTISIPLPPVYLFGRRYSKLERIKACFGVE